MADKKYDSDHNKSDFDVFSEQISAKAIEGVDKDFLIEKQNLAGKRLLRQLPFQIFILVADADGKTDKKEMAEFKEFLNQREMHCSNPYTRRMFHASIVNFSSLTNRYLAGHIKKDISVVKKAMKFISICASQRIVQEICKDLKELAVAIAEASGGFIGMTSPISTEEDDVIQQLDKVFNEAIAHACGEDVPKKGLLDI